MAIIIVMITIINYFYFYLNPSFLIIISNKNYNLIFY